MTKQSIEDKINALPDDLICISKSVVTNLEARVKRLKIALEFYAMKEVTLTVYDPNERKVNMTNAFADKARRALQDE
jgi:hypothetical protein